MCPLQFSRFFSREVICRRSLAVGWGRGCCYAKHYSVKNCQLVAAFRITVSYTDLIHFTLWVPVNVCISEQMISPPPHLFKLKEK